MPLLSISGFKVKKYSYKGWILFRLYVILRKGVPKIIRPQIEYLLYRRGNEEKGVWVSLGSTCFSALVLGEICYRKFSGPFDWFKGWSLKGRLNCLINNDCLKILNKDDLKFKEENEREGTVVAYNERYNIVFPHDFKKDGDDAYQVAFDRYERRFGRLLKVMANAKVVNFLYVRRAFDLVEDLNEIINLLVNIREMYNIENVSILIMEPAEKTRDYFEIIDVSGVRVVLQEYNKSFIKDDDWRGMKLEELTKKFISSYNKQFI